MTDAKEVIAEAREMARSELELAAAESWLRVRAASIREGKADPWMQGEVDREVARREQADA